MAEHGNEVNVAVHCLMVRVGAIDRSDMTCQEQEQAEKILWMTFGLRKDLFSSLECGLSVCGQVSR